MYPDAECLLLAFEEAKLSIVAVDSRTRSLKTISLHSYDDEYLRGGNTKNFPSPLIRVRILLIIDQGFRLIHSVVVLLC